MENSSDLRARIFEKEARRLLAELREIRANRKNKKYIPHQRERKPADHSVHDQEYRAADTPSTTQDDVRFSTTDQPLQSDIGFYSQGNTQLQGSSKWPPAISGHAT